MELKCFLGNFTAKCWLSTFDSVATNDLLSNIDTSYRFDMLRPGRIVLSRCFPCFVFAAIDAGWSRSQKENPGLYIPTPLTCFFFFFWGDPKCKLHFCGGPGGTPKCNLDPWDVFQMDGFFGGGGVGEK